MKRLWWIGVLIALLAVVWAEAQEKPTLEPVQPVEPIPDREKVVDKGRLSPIEKITPTPEAEKTLDKSVFGPMPRTEPIPEVQKTLEKWQLKNASPVSGLQEPAPEYIPTGLKGLSPVAVLQEPQIQYNQLALKEMAPVQGVDGISYQVQEFRDFRGGLDLVSAKTKVAPNCAIELENALWNPQGEMYKRPRYSEHSTPPEVLNFLYRYYQQDGDKWTMGGSDTALYFWHEDSSGWTYLIGTEGTSGRWDGTTFEDLFVGTHEGIEPVVWDGDTLLSLSGVVDSFYIELWTPSFVDEDMLSGYCREDSEVIKIDQPLWDANEWISYIVDYPLAYDLDGDGDRDTVIRRWDIVMNNTEECLYISPGFQPHDYTILSKSASSDTGCLMFKSYFGIDTVWREGQIDSVVACTSDMWQLYSPLGWRFMWGCLDQESENEAGYNHSYAKIYDDFGGDSTWDSTLNYDEYIFEVVRGKGSGKKCFMGSYFGADADARYGAVNSEWGDDSSFFIYAYTANCFDSTTEYRIYKPAFIAEGAKFVENFDGRIWFGWTGLGSEQNKNNIIFSKLNTMGDFPPENHIIIESEDGDNITGMAKFPGEYTDVPRQELIVTKNNSLYKIVPSGDGYNFWLIQSGVGCVSNSAISPAEGILLFPDQHGVWAYDKRKPVSISKLIDPIFEAWDTENLEDVSAVYNPQDRHYYMSFPESTIAGDLSNLVVCWAMSHGDSGGFVFVQYYDDAYNPIDTNIPLTSWDNRVYTGTNDVCMDDSGNTKVVYARTHSAWDERSYAQRLNQVREIVGSPLQVDRDSGSGAEVPQSTVGNDSLGNFFAVAGRGDHLWLKCYTDASAFIESLQVTEYAYGDEPCIATNRAGRSVIVWTDYYNWGDGNEYGNIYGQIVGSDRVKVGSNFKVNDNTYYADSTVCEATASVAIDSGGGFIVAWTTCRYANKEDVYMQRFLANGTKVGINQRVNSSIVHADSLDYHPTVAMSPDGYACVVWFLDSPAGDEVLYIQRYDQDTTKVGDNIWIDLGLDYSPAYAAPNHEVAMDDAKNIAVVFVTESPDDLKLRVYDWSLVPLTDFLTVDSGQLEQPEGAYPSVTFASKTLLSSDSTIGTLAWSFDYHGWSRETFDASAYCYQHSLSDDVKILFADPEDTFVYNYATQADDIGDPVILTYQTPYFNFGQYPSFDYEMRFATVEAFLDTGNIYLTWYKNYSDLVYYDSLVCGSDCREEMLLPEDLWGWNISMKLRTGSDIDDFTLSRFWWEYTENQNRK